jgi:glycosyltransferase involved in cell wall biosynthesis
MRAARLTLFAPNLSGGGAERVLARLATHWAEQGRDVTLVTLAAPSPEDFPLPGGVHRIGLDLTVNAAGLFGAVRNNLRRIAALRETFRASRPDVIVSFIEQANVLALLAARPLRIPVVISERTDPALHPVSRLWQFLRRRTYPRCAAIVVLTDEIAERMGPVVRGRPVIVIPNGIAAPAVPQRERSSLVILGVGRLDGAKGFDRLVEAFSLIADRYPQWTLTVLGDGPQRRSLERSIADRGLTARVTLPGRVADPSEWYARAEVFALPSRYEGFPNALLEAMASGLPAVAFDGPSAVRQVLRHGIDGLLVPQNDVLAFAEAIGVVMADPAKRRRMGEAAREVVTRFSLDAFFARWDAPIDAAAKGDFAQVPGHASE